MTFGANAASRETQWKQVDDSLARGLPRTAITNLEDIIRSALQDKAWPEAAKAILRRAVVEGSIQGGKPEERIRVLEKELKSAPGEIVPMLKTVLAHWYWDYFRQNRWRFMRRTAVTEIAADDFTTWDLQRLFAHIDELFTEALQAEAVLKSIPIAEWDDLLVKGTLPDSYRPTLYDFIAHEALQFYTSGEQAAALPEDAFEIPADSPVFDTIDAFIAWDPAVGLTPEARKSPALKAIRIYQELLRFHRNDPDATARIDVDLERLNWAANVAFGENKNSRYKLALKRIADEEGDHELASMALFKMAEVTRAEGDLVEARKLALRGYQAHPNSPGGKSCFNLVAEIESRELTIQTERLWSEPRPTIHLRYRNITNVWFRLVSWNWDELSQRRRPWELLDEHQTAAALAKKPDYAWSHPLPQTTNYQTSVLEVPVPSDVAPGFYFLIASANQDFSKSDNQLSFTSIWVSDLTFVVRPLPGRLQGFVLEANSGEPIEGAEVTAFYFEPSGTRSEVEPVKTDANGLFVLKTEQPRGLLLKITARGQTVASSWEYTPTLGEPEQLHHVRTIFFTDRALYRPGQLIQYKGICIEVDPSRENYQTLEGREVTVVFLDANGEEVARQHHRSNAYGSFSGSFVAPAGRLTGQMRIEVTSGPPGMTWVRVEEYKRPKFYVSLNPPKEAPKLDSRVSIEGKAIAYTGAAINGAKVKYRVVRNTRMPWQYSTIRYRMPWLGLPEQEIAHGITTTRDDGTFNIEFRATPDRRVPEKDDPRFVFSVHVDVTDSTGETRSCDRSVTIGYTALEVRIETNDWQCEDQPFEVRLKTTSLDDEPQRVEGVFRVYALKMPPKVQRPSLFSTDRIGEIPDDSDELASGLADTSSWPSGDVVYEKQFETDGSGSVRFTVALKTGVYRVAVETKDRFNKHVKATRPLMVLNPNGTRFGIPLPFHFTAAKWSIEPSEEFVAIWGTGYETGRAFIELEHRGKLLQAYWTRKGDTQAKISQVVTDSLRGGFDLRVTFVRENRLYFVSKHIEVPWSNKQFKIRWEHFTSKLDPGSKQTWTAIIEPSVPVQQQQTQSAEVIAAEMVATLYDRSLDQFLPFNWPTSFGVFGQNIRYIQQHFGNEVSRLQTFHQSWRIPHQRVSWTYRTIPPDIISTRSYFGLRMRALAQDRLRAATTEDTDKLEEHAVGMKLLTVAPSTSDTALAAAPTAAKGLGTAAEPSQADREPFAPPSPKEAVSRAESVVPRRNLVETAFFFPHLVSDTTGRVQLTFTIPETLTEWRFLGFAHDTGLRAGLLEDFAVTARELMVQPNPPRFLREGDSLEFTVKVINQSDRRQKGVVRVAFSDVVTGQSADTALNNSAPEKIFDLGPRDSAAFAWSIHIPEGYAALSYKAVAATDTLSDGEEGLLPVITKRVLVTESLPLAVSGRGTQTIKFESFAEALKSPTIQAHSLTVQMVSNPAWYAVMALPYLMQFPYECAEQVFNRYYANALASFIANSDPRIRQVFELWKNTPALESPLTKNKELKSVALEETPWVCDAENESQARRNIGILFDENRLASELGSALQQLQKSQLPDGAWSWFPGGPPNHYITLYICTGFGRLRHLGLDVTIEPALRAVQYLDSWLSHAYENIKKQKTESKNHLSPTIAFYLYGRSFFMKERPIHPNVEPAFRFFLTQAKDHWLTLRSRQSQAHIALALKRLGETDTAVAIVSSLKERSVTTPELGRFWRDAEFDWWWYNAPIETQATMIEAFSEITNDSEVVEECKVWLLKQKQTQNWRTTKATADAVYALLLRGRNLLEDAQTVKISLGSVDLTHTKQIQPEPGTGFFQRLIPASEIKPEMSKITVTKETDGIAWGSVHWQYFQDIANVKPYEGTPLKLRKSLFTKSYTSSGPVLRPVRGPVAVGDELVVRIELQVDRDMEYIHLKDHRGSGTEPTNVLSGYRFQDGLGYYESTRDTATHFFIDYLPRGTYVFEYSTRVQHRGQYQTGFASIQCLYAPEFNSHSESLLIEAR